jgi:hypothetical protein
MAEGMRWTLTDDSLESRVFEWLLNENPLGLCVCSVYPHAYNQIAKVIVARLDPEQSDHDLRNAGVQVACNDDEIKDIVKRHYRWR